MTQQDKKPLKRYLEAIIQSAIWDAIKIVIKWIVSIISSGALTFRSDFLDLAPKMGNFITFVAYTLIVYGLITIIIDLSNLATLISIPWNKTQKIYENLTQLDTYEKAILREFWFQERNTILVPTNDTAVISLLRKDIIENINSGKSIIGVGRTCIVEIPEKARSFIEDSGLELIGLQKEVGIHRQLEELEDQRPSFVWRIEFRKR